MMTLTTMTTLLLQLVALYTLLNAVVQTCPVECDCGYRNSSSLQFYVSDCSRQQLSMVPQGLPNITQLLNLSDNRLSSIPENSVQNLYQMSLLDARKNRELHHLPLLERMLINTTIYVDSGSTCCQYEIEWENKAGLIARNRAREICIPTSAIDECKANILDWLDFVIYGLVLLIAPPLNIWVFAVTVGTKTRLHDPMTFTTTQYCIANLLLIIYTSVIFAAGIIYYNVYPRYSAEWLNNPGCSFVGFILIASTLASGFFYMLDGITFFLKLHYPLNQERHMTMRRLCIYIIIIWALSLLLAAIPFFTGGRYNKVNLCLPFYAGDYDFSYQYVILYTCVSGISVVIEIIMVIWLVKSVVKTRSSEVNSPALTQENRRLQCSVVSMIVFNSIFSVVIVAFLGLSCAGGREGQIGRNYFAKISIVESVANPIFVALKKKRFRRDTVKLLRKCHCCENRDNLNLSSHHHKDTELLHNSRINHRNSSHGNKVEPEPLNKTNNDKHLLESENDKADLKIDKVTK